MSVKSQTCVGKKTNKPLTEYDSLPEAEEGAAYAKKNYKSDLLRMRDVREVASVTEEQTDTQREVSVLQRHKWAGQRGLSKSEQCAAASGYPAKRAGGLAEGLPV
jgi:hypothetical protein